MKNFVPIHKRHIVVIGGALWSLPVARAARMLKYLRSLSEKRSPRLLVLNTASGDAASAKLSFYNAFVAMNETCRLSFLNFFEHTPVDLRSLVLSQDIIFVNGGNTKSMLAVWREYGVDKLLSEAWRQGIILAGSSAGGICWFESCLTDSFADSYTSLPALGILKGSCCPHYDGEADRRGTYHALINAGELGSGYAIDEATAIHFVGAKLQEIVTVSPRKEASAYRVTTGKAGVRERILPATRLAAFKSK